MRNILPTAMIALLLPVVAQATDNPAAINTQAVEQAWMDLAIKDAQESGRTIDGQRLRNNFLRDELLSREAIRLGIDKQPDFSVREEIKR